MYSKHGSGRALGTRRGGLTGMVVAVATSMATVSLTANFNFDLTFTF